MMDDNNGGCEWSYLGCAGLAGLAGRAGRARYFPWNSSVRCLLLTCQE